MYGKESRITIDDRLPGTARGTRFYPSFARKSRNGAWWATFVEKAAAKLNGSYRKLSGGNNVESLHMLTGMPVFHYGTRGNDIKSKE